MMYDVQFENAMKKMVEEIETVKSSLIFPPKV
jgi:hypothetical protein